MTFCNCVTSLESRDPEIGRGVPNASATVKNKQTNDVSIFYIPIVFCAKYIDRTTRQRPSKSFDSCASFMTAIFAVNFDWSVESCDKAPRDLNYERNTEKYGCAMKLAIVFS